jgi:AcrR family transcriptional regulator
LVVARRERTRARENLCRDAAYLVSIAGAKVRPCGTVFTRVHYRTVGRFRTVVRHCEPAQLPRNSQDGRAPASGGGRAVRRPRLRRHLDDLAERVGIAKASLYNYYAAKEDLLVDLVERALAAWDAATLPALDTGGSLEHRARLHFRAVADFVARDPHGVGILNLAASVVSGPARQRVHQLLATHHEAVFVRARRDLAAAIAAGELPDADPDDFLAYAEVFLNGLVLSQCSSPHLSAPVTERLPQLWRMYWRGLSGRPPQQELDP